MGTLLQIKDGIKDRLDSLNTATTKRLSCYSVEPASPHYPCAWPFLRSAEYDATFDGAMLWTFSINVAIGTGDTGQAQVNLMPFLAPTGSSSIKAAFDADPTLGGAADYAVLRRIEAVGTISVAGQNALGAVLVLEVAT